VTVAPAPRKSLAYIKDETDYYPHQIEGVRNLARRTSFILADEMGLGKTLETLTVFAVDVERGWAKRLLVVAPPTLKPNWVDEIDKFTRFHRLVLEGTPAKRREQIVKFIGMPDPKVLIVNYEQVKPHLKDLNGLKFDAVVYDEAHLIKNPKSERTKAAHHLRANRHFVLTGSPMLNHVNELWSLLHRIAPAEFPNYWTFVHRYCLYGGYQDKQIIGVKNERELKALLEKHMLRRLKKDVLGLPDKQHILVEVDLHPEQAKLYKTLKEELTDDLPDTINETDVNNALTKFLRLKQVCGTTLPFTGEDHSWKLDRIEADVLELVDNGDRVVIFTQFRDVHAALTKRLHNDDDVPVWGLTGSTPASDRAPLVSQWGAAKEPGALVCMLQVAGVGLNMTASRHALFADKLFVPKLNEQAEDRLHRIGASATQSVQIRSYLCRKTIELRVERILTAKRKEFDTVVEENTFRKKLIEALLEEEDD
jgi:SNF2 family DNA or RNA helicase